MSQTLTYTIGSDRRALVDNIQDFKVDFGDDNQNWVQARQFERGMRQVFVNVVNEDSTPFDLTGCNVWFEGLLPKTANGGFRVIDSDGYVPLDPSAGKFRFDMPGQAFTVAGSYRQAFFRIVKNGDSVTTLEFDLDVLADKVIDGLVPKDWIGPFEQIADQLVDDLQKHTDAADKIISDSQQKVTDLVNQLNQQGTTTTSMLTELQNRITDLEAKIKQDGLFTQAEADAFNKSIEQTFQANLNDFEATMNNKIERLSQDSVNHILRYHSISVSVSPNMQLTDNDIAHLQKLNTEATLISMVNITNNTDSNPQLDNDSRINDAISRLKNANIKIDMLKPHLGVNWSDGFYRGDYDPALYSDFFDNWKNILLHYAEICNQNDIPILCIGCEQVKTFQVAYAESWNDIIAKIHTAYPNLLLTAAFNQLEQVPSYNWPANLDYIGTNVYPALSPYFDENDLLKLDDLKTNFYYDMRATPWGARISAINDAYHLPIFVTECGCMPEKDGLVQLMSQYASQTPYDYHVSALFMETAFSGWMKEIPSIIGFAWWHVRDPFNFYDGETESEAEMIYKKYVGGGLI